jgi:hypothetical protein
MIAAPCILGTLALVIAGCGAQHVPMQVNVTQLAPYVHAAKDPACSMPVFEAMPLSSYRQVAIVEAWADLKDQENDVIPALKRKACETGADALVILNSQHQDIKHLLYQASPNETLNEVTQQNTYAGQGAYIAEVEHTRRMGEPGHNGLYIDAVAINYGKTEDKAVPASRNSTTESLAPPVAAKPNS